jgi:hypothetical protein
MLEKRTDQEASGELLRLFPLIVFGCVWAGFGIFAFVQISAWGRIYEHNVALVASGKVPAETLYIASMNKGTGNQDDGRYIGLSTTYPPVEKITEYEHVISIKDLEIGMPMDAYRIDGRYFIPKIHTGGHEWGKWLFLAFGLVPPLLGTAFLVIRRKLRQRKGGADRAHVPIDPETYIIGDGAYHNLQLAQAFDDAHIFRIEAAPIPFTSVVGFNAMIVAAMIAFHLVFKHAEPTGALWLVYAGPITVGLLTCGVFNGIAYWSFTSAHRKGDWLVYDKEKHRLELAREQLSFDLDEIVHLQYITTRRLTDGNRSQRELLSELNLITNQSGQRKRWPILRSSLSDKAFDELLRPLAQCTELPIVRIKEHWWSGEITVTRWPDEDGSK